MSLRAGVCVDIWDGGELSLVMFMAEEKGRLRVLTRKGREMRVTSSRVAVVGDHVLDLQASRADQVASLGARDDELAAQAEAVDVRALWEILADESGEYDLDELTELACGTSDGTNRSVVLRRLIGDGLYFVRKKLVFVPRTREDLGETVRRRRTQEQRALQRAEFIEAARGRMRGADASEWPDGANRYLGALRDLAIRGADSERLKEATALLGELGRDGRGDPSMAAFDVMHRLGLFQRDENLLLLKYEIQREFPPEVEEEVRRLLKVGVVREDQRRDLTALACYAVDDAETTEIDDALSFEAVAGDRFRIGVHIADPGPYIPPGGLLDQMARDRATTFYLPEERILMLPPALSESLASLLAGETRTALSFLFELDAAGTVHSSEIVESMIRVDRRLTYQQTDLLIRLGGGAARLDEPLEAFELEPLEAAEQALLPDDLPVDLAT